MGERGLLKHRYTSSSCPWSSQMPEGLERSLALHHYNPFMAHVGLMGGSLKAITHYSLRGLLLGGPVEEILPRTQFFPEQFFLFIFWTKKTYHVIPVISRLYPTRALLSSQHLFPITVQSELSRAGARHQPFLKIPR